MNTPSDISFRLALAKGFLAEAEQDLTLERWRSCVDNSQLKKPTPFHGTYSRSNLPMTHCKPPVAVFRWSRVCWPLWKPGGEVSGKK
jgi:hypothetical protein